MEKYRRIPMPKPQSKISENEIRITAIGKIRNYISYASNLLQIKGAEEIVLKAMGQAISKTITVAEILKRRIPDLHQTTSLDSTDIKEIWEPIEEGLENVETTRHVSSIQIILSKKPLDPNDPGYQPPLPPSQVTAHPEPRPYSQGPPAPRGGYRGRGRGFGYDPSFFRGRGQNPRGGAPRGGFRDRGFRDGGFRDGGFREGGFREGGFREGGFREGGFREGRGGYGRGGYPSYPPTETMAPFPMRGRGRGGRGRGRGFNRGGRGGAVRGYGPRPTYAPMPQNQGVPA